MFCISIINKGFAQTFISSDEPYKFTEHNNFLYFDVPNKVKYINDINEVKTVKDLNNVEIELGRLTLLNNSLYALGVNSGKIYTLNNGIPQLVQDISPSKIHYLTIYNNKLTAITSLNNIYNLRVLDNNISLNFPHTVLNPHFIEFDGELYIQYYSQTANFGDQLWKFNGTNLVFVSSEFSLKEGKYQIQKLDNVLIGVSKNSQLIGFNGSSISVILNNIHLDNDFRFDRSIIFDNKFYITDRLDGKIHIIDANLNYSLYTPLNNLNIYGIYNFNNELYYFSLTEPSSTLSKLITSGANINETLVINDDIGGTNRKINFFNNKIVYINYEGQLNISGNPTPVTCFDPPSEETGGIGSIIGIRENTYI